MSVLITNACSEKSLAVLHSLGTKKIKAVTCDSKNLCPAFFSRYSRYRFLYPDPSNFPVEFINTIVNFLKKKKTEMVFPVNSTETLLISKYKEKIMPFTKVPFEDYSKMIILHDKGTLMNIASELGINVPETYSITKNTNIKELSKTLQYPVVIKPRKATSSVGVSYANNKDEFIMKLEKTVNMFHSSNDLPIVQEYIKGTGCGVSVLMNHGDLRAFFVHKRLREYPVTGGPSTLRVSIRHPEMEKMAFKLLENLKWHGLAMVEFKLNEKTDTPFLIEANPRVWGSIYQAIVSGVDFPYLLYKMAVEDDVERTSSYRIGIKTRFLLNDLRSFTGYMRLNSNKVSTLNEFLKHDKYTYYDTFYPDDPLPAFMFTFVAIQKLFNDKYKIAGGINETIS